MAEERWLRIPGILSEVATACDFVVQVAEYAGLDERGIYHCRLAVEEACTNIIEHGYQFAGDDKTIDIVCYIDSDSLTITLIDEGPLYNPLMKPDPDPRTPLWDREGGGWGVAFIKKVMDAVDYQQTGGRNQLIMKKRIR